jgi:hypothetical protein
MPFGPAAAVVTAGVGLYEGSQQRGAIKDGQDQANANALKTQAVAKDTFAPYMGAGTNALSSYSNLLGLNGQDAADASMKNFQTSPGYGYAVKQGLQAVDHGAAANGMLRSGETLRAEQTLGNDLANQEFGNYLGRLNGMTNMGLQASGAMLNAYTGQANNIQSTATGAAGANAGIYGTEGKTLTSSLDTVGKSLGQMYQSNTGLFGPSSQTTSTNALFDGSGGNLASFSGF